MRISGRHLVAVEEGAESDDEEEENAKLLISGNSAPGSGSKFPQKKK